MVRKLDKPKVTEIRLDCHTHIYSNPRPRANKCWRDPGSRSLVSFIEHVRRARINAVAITNAGDDWNYERYVSQAVDLPEKWGYYRDERMAQILNPEGVPYTFIKAEELFTKEGHMLVLGTQFGQMFQPVATIQEFEQRVSKKFRLDGVLDEIEKDKLLIKVSDHTDYHRGGLGSTGALSGRENRFDAYEWNALAPKGANQLVVERARRDEKPLVYGSDCHRPRHVGYAGIDINSMDLDFDNGDGFIASLGKCIKTRNFTGFGRQLPLSAWLHHAYMLFIDHNLRLYDKDVATDDFNLDEARKRLFEVKNE